jgi:two-component system sensor histidine kinase PilS (NtrC family)
VTAIAIDVTSATEITRLLRLFGWARLGTAQLLLLLAPLLPPELVPDASRGFLTVLVLAVVVTSAGLLLAGNFAQPRRVAGLVCVLDAILITAVVSATGGPRSIYAFLYVLSVSAACLLLPRTAALAVAGFSSLLYTGIVAARTIFPLTALFEPPAETTALEVLTMFLNSGTFLAVGIVAGGLAEQYRTARAEVERQRRDVRDLQAFKAVVLQSVGAGLIVLDRGATVTALNRAAEEITGASAALTIGGPWTALFGEAVPLDAVEADLAREPLAAPRREVVSRRPDGREVPLRLTFSALRSHDGRRLGMVAVCEDLSEIRAMEVHMREADRLAALGRMAANIAHEVRNPLASMSGAIEALTSDALGADERGRLTAIVGHESARLNDIIGNFLDYARPAPLVRTCVDVAVLLDEVLTLLEHRPLSPQIKVVREVPETLRWDIDAQQIRQAIWNVCLNAVEAMPDGGELRVDARVDGDTLWITVTDTGTGIAASDLPHVFEPFFSTKAGGTGLGLALVQRVARDHGGWVDLRSLPGVGTSVVLGFPGPGRSGRSR